MPSSSSPVDELLSRARLWKGRGRPDLAREELEKLFRIDPGNPDALAEQALVEVKADRPKAALGSLIRLRQAQPDHPRIPRIAALLRIYGADRNKLGHARLLARSGRREEALAAYRNLFGGGAPPDEALALEYWQLVAATPDGWEAARDGLASLVRESPGIPRYDLALAVHESSRQPLDRAALRRLIALTRDPDHAGRARAAWREAVMREPPGGAAIDLLRHYLAHDPRDAGVRERLDALVRAEEERQRQLADPFYQAKMAGLALLEEGRLDAAAERLEHALGGRPGDGEAAGALGLVRLRQGRHGEAHRLFGEAERADRDNVGKWQSLARTARYWGLMREAGAARETARFGEAEEMLREAQSIDPAAPHAFAALADLQRELGRSPEAEEGYGEALRLQPDHGGALRGLIALYIDQGRRAEAEALMAGLSEGQRAALNEGHALDRLRVRIWREEADARLAEGRAAEAIDRLRLALAVEDSWSGPPPLSTLRRLPLAEGEASRLTVEKAPDAAARSDNTYQYRRLADLLDRQGSWFSSAQTWQSRSGDPGASRLEMVEIPLEWRRPGGRGGERFFRADAVRIEAGSVDRADPENAGFGTLALCAPDCPPGRSAERASGLGLTAGFEEGGVKADLGTTPLGFPVSSLVGGVARSGDLGPFSYSLEIARRPVTGSLLSFAGARDPRTGKVWGGVVASGGRLGLSRDEGGEFGFWSSLGLHRLSGLKVVENDRVQLMGGGYWRLIDEQDRLLSLGVTGMAWRFSRNAGEYSWGHGGYYSPQRYESISLPVTFARREARYSWSMRAALSVSRSVTAGAPYYPTDPLLQHAAEGLSGADYAASAGQGVGYSLYAGGEYQWSPRLFVGGRVEIERSDYYAPNRLSLYLRYAVDGAAARPVPLTPDPVIPTSRF